MNTIPCYPETDHVGRLLAMDWRNSGQFVGLTTEQQLAMFLHASPPLRYLLWRSLSWPAKAAMIEHGGRWIHSAILYMCRGKSNRYWRDKIAEDRDEYVQNLHSRAALDLWVVLTREERLSLIEPIDNEYVRAIWQGLDRYFRIEVWRWIGATQHAKLWPVLCEFDGCPDFHHEMSDFAAVLESIPIVGRDYDIAESFAAAYDNIRATADYVSLADLAAALSVCTGTARARAKKLGYKVRKGDVYRP